MPPKTHTWSSKCPPGSQKCTQGAPRGPPRRRWRRPRGRQIDRVSTRGNTNAQVAPPRAPSDKQKKCLKQLSMSLRSGIPLFSSTERNPIAPQPFATSLAKSQTAAECQRFFLASGVFGLHLGGFLSQFGGGCWCKLTPLSVRLHGWRQNSSPVQVKPLFFGAFKSSAHSRAVHVVFPQVCNIKNCKIHNII